MFTYYIISVILSFILLFICPIVCLKIKKVDLKKLSKFWISSLPARLEIIYKFTIIILVLLLIATPIVNYVISLLAITILIGATTDELDEYLIFKEDYETKYKILIEHIKCNNFLSKNEIDELIQE